MRDGVHTLGTRRAERRTRFLVTGATGFLGSHLFIALCERGHRVTLLCRPGKHAPVRDRVNEILAWFGKTPACYPHLAVVEGRIEVPRFGLPDAAYRRLAAGTDEIIHCAGSTDFSRRNHPATSATNIGALGNVLDLAAAGRCVFFHHISTAYAAGASPGPCREQLVDTATFCNAYEETKNGAEHLASGFCAARGIRLSIYRPSIVYGDSRTGRSRKFNALYFPVKTIIFLRDVLAGDIRDNGGARARAMGVRVAADGRVHLPIRLPVRPGGTINLIPVDFFTAAVMALVEEDLAGGIHHIVNHRPNTLDDLVEYTNRFAGIAGPTVANERALAAGGRNPLEQLFESYIAMYLPYLSDLRRFSTEHTAAILDKRSVACPAFTYEVFRRCIEYALAVDWGKNLTAA
ncbi:MAG: SDR family oxidoreductase [Candidatus Edwardsbacteria bacterium]|jgi:nucleoside-diphosphate-sugar epimerase|nr:SDR family oxidoreductase [Candidatus Edwardsbacteria bacterium]